MPTKPQLTAENELLRAENEMLRKERARWNKRRARRSPKQFVTDQLKRLPRFKVVRTN